MKKLLSLVLCFVLILGLCGCAGKTAVDTSSAASSAVSSIVSSAVSQTESKPETKSWFTRGTVKFTAADLQKAKTQTFVKPKNVIILIGDGMGLNDITIANAFAEKRFEFGLVLDNLLNVGKAQTNSLDGTTDSAASGTALATGIKTKNGYVGLDKDLKPLKNATELAREMGKKIGVVTNDTIYGATPAAFTVHSESRNNTAEILQKQAAMKLDVLIGDGYSQFISDVDGDAISHLNVAQSELYWEMKLNADLEGKKCFYGFMNADHTTENNLLAQATEIALNRLTNDKGFFLMVECATPDKGGHENSILKKKVGVSNLDKAVAVAVKYCLEHPDTVLIVTSDHETGGVVLPKGKLEYKNNVFTTTNHTPTHVGVFALGFGTERFNNIAVDNTEIAKFLHSAIKGDLKG